MPETYVVRLARAKAACGWVASMELRPPAPAAGAPVLAADTAVVLDGRILVKPADREDGERMLRELSGRTHQVLTAVAAGDRRRAAIASQPQRSHLSSHHAGRGSRLLGYRGALRQSRRLCHPGPRGHIHRESARQLFGRHGVAAVRDRGIARDGRRTAMAVEILINASLHEARAAVVENGVLQEVFLERASRRGLISNIYKGRVSRVLPGMQAAFIEIGMERTAFLHASDIFDPRHARNRHRACRARTTSAPWCPKATRFSCRWSRIRSAPRARG